MIASAPRRNEAVEENTSLADYTQNLFAGLTFPEVPTSDVKQLPKQPHTANLIDQFDDDYNNTDAMIELQAPAPKAAIRHEVPAQQEISTQSSTPAKVTLSSQQFSLLYGPENCDSAVAYPSLPSINSEETALYNGSILEHQPPPYSQTLIDLDDEDEVEDENAPFLAPTISRVSDDSRESEIRSSQQQGQDEDNLMSDLVQENLRLQQQLQALQDSMSATAQSSTQQQQQHQQWQHQQQLQQHQVLQQQQQQIQAQQQAYRAHQQSYQQLQHQQQSQQQQPVQTHTGAPQLKYVCCGGCQQWLSAPNDAVYVYCPGCESVNNCSLRPGETASSTAAPERAPARRVGDNQPWYLQCFSRVLS